ncbi:MAG: aldehyde dehydrogenase family protein, partial [Rhodospirillales bacterium]|nr:aldehyde dehydrogenase family protein [Rhodospirillales bacterium]
AVSAFETPEEGIAMANDSDYGLTASVFTGSNKTAHNAARALRAGTVSVNCYSEGDAATPFGGYKLSGFGGRDKSLAAHDHYCETKTIWIDLS